MDFSEIVGFIITLLALFLMFFNKAKRSHQPVEEGEEESSATLKEFLQSIEDDLRLSKDFKEDKSNPKKQKKVEKEKKVVSAPKQLGHENYSFKSEMDSFKAHNTIENRKLTSAIELKKNHLTQLESREEKTFQSNKSSRGHHLLQSLSSKKQMVVLHEILKPPKGL